MICQFQFQECAQEMSTDARHFVDTFCKSYSLQLLRASYSDTVYCILTGLNGFVEDMCFN